MSDSSIYENLSQLGSQTPLPNSPDEAILETVSNPRRGVSFVVRFTQPEFTSLCPLTNQPDFAHLIIDYIPDRLLIESKSLKLFLGSFRNHGAFHEDCTIGIAQQLEQALSPVWLRIGGYWHPRGGMPIDVFYQSGPVPKGVWLPKQGVSTYRGRG